VQPDPGHPDAAYNININKTFTYYYYYLITHIVLMQISVKSDNNKTTYEIIFVNIYIIIYVNI
jgi:hypothetical protein